MVSPRSSPDPRVAPAIAPNSTPSVMPISDATSASRSVFTSATDRSDHTDRPVASERPRSPCTTWPSHRPNWIGSGRSRPYSCLICSTTSCGASAGTMAFTGSPGAMCTSMKHTRLTASAMGTA